jgi:hypothetical protein
MKKRGMVRAAFDKGQIPTIACFNKAKTPLGIDLDKLLAALQKFVNDCIVPVWGTPANLVRSTGFVKGYWALVFMDNSNQADDLAYHDLTPDGFPVSSVFVKTIAADKSSLSSATSHELVEMLVDPAINLYTTGPDEKLVYAYEAGDPVEEESFKVDGVEMTNFVYPSYFEVFHKPHSTQFDYMKKVTRPFQILKGGYQIVFRNGKESQITGSKPKAKRFGKEDRTHHRSELRGVHKHPGNCRSKPVWGTVVRRFGAGGS